LDGDHTVDANRFVTNNRRTPFFVVLCNLFGH